MATYNLVTPQIEAHTKCCILVGKTFLIGQAEHMKADSDWKPHSMYKLVVSELFWKI